MRVLKTIGAIVVAVALLAGIGIVGRIETEDDSYRRGEISKSEMTGDDVLFKRIITVIAIAIGGGITWAIASYIEAEQIERAMRRMRPRRRR